MNYSDASEQELPTISVLVVDDHAVVRKGLRMFFDAVAGITVVGEAADGWQAIQMVDLLVAAQTPPQVVLMDLAMPQMTGIDATHAIHERHPDVAVVALTSYSDIHRINAALEAGAAGYLLKDAEPDDVATAVRAAAGGRVHLDPDVARLLAMSMRTVVSGNDLTKREIEVLVLVADGKSNQHIADALYISERTARTHVSHVINKLGLESRVQAALWAVRNGLVTLS